MFTKKTKMTIQEFVSLAKESNARVKAISSIDNMIGDGWQFVIVQKTKKVDIYESASKIELIKYDEDGCETSNFGMIIFN